ncbi:hypothetical protein BON30_46210 [Cystobacter ferrugineus]|uniref:Lipoprotein n=1 Tax=Cystobacter ferrugineus TaxID=83449 RepID=A0A1L9AVA6_9BACT|nr:hypothetical protein BON30_46210 [Cystobacter ferrugineus]
MRSLEIVAIALLLSGCASTNGGGRQLRQAAPAYSPQPTRAPGPAQIGNTYRPAGTTLYGVGEAAPRVEEVPRSPNRRVLPPTGEPGLWAADEARASATKYPTVADIELPLPTADESNLGTLFCAHKIHKLLTSEGQMRQLMDLRYDDRRCVVAQLYAFCWDKEIARARSDGWRGKLESARDEISLFLAHACRNTRSGKNSTETIRNAVQRVWDLVDKRSKR